MIKVVRKLVIRDQTQLKCLEVKDASASGKKKKKS